MRAAIIIPSRFESSRFPGKPLASIAGRSLIQRVSSLARACSSCDEVVVATDDERIRNHVEQTLDVKVVMTSKECANGSERVLEAAKLLDVLPDIIINLQGDSPLTPPWILDELCRYLKENSNVQIATPAVRISESTFHKLGEASRTGSAGGTFVVRDFRGRALYFSKSPIPFVRNRKQVLPLFKHLGVYGYRREMLERYVGLSPGELEEIEGLEQLRLLEHGIDVQVVEVDFRGKEVWSVDGPDDVLAVEDIIKRQGELIVS